MGARSIAIGDARGQGGSLRVTRHPDQGKVVLSHWRDGVCVASTPVELDELPELIALLADALGDAARRSESRVVASGAVRPGVLARIKLWLRPHLAPIVELGTALRHQDEGQH